MKTTPISQRISALPPYLFDEIDQLKAEALAQGVKVIDFGVGDPDQATPKPLITELCNQANSVENQQYPAYNGLREFRAGIKSYYQRRGVPELDETKEIIALIGSKEGIAHLPLALIDPGDVVLVPDPGYPVYLSATYFAGGSPHLMPLRAENDFLPDLQAIPESVANKAKLLFINYPNNPTTGTATLDFFTELTQFADKYGIIICHDASYLDITFRDYRAPSFLETEFGKEVGIEMYSLSKTFNMTGWRIAAAIGNQGVIEALLKIKKNIDSGVFNPIQYAGIKALNHLQGPDPDTMKAYALRRSVFCECLEQLGWHFQPPLGTFYIWVALPEKTSSLNFAKKLLAEVGLLVAPGIGFGNHGEGYIRFSLTLPTDEVQEAAQRLLKWSGV